MLNHGGSFNGKDIKKAMNNVTYLFDVFVVISKEGERDWCLLSDADINTMCLHFREENELWDGAFSSSQNCLSNK